MTTRSNLHYSVDAESLQRSLHDALQHSASAPLATPVHPATSTTGTASPFVLQPTVSLALSTTLEQNFKILSEFSKSEYLKWHPIFASYQTQGAIRPLAQCMEPTVQNTFMYTLKLDRPSFFATSSDTLDLLIQSHFKLNVVENCCALLVPMTNKAQFDERACDLYISHVVNLLVTYRLIFDVSNGGVLKKIFHKCFFSLYLSDFIT